MALSLLLTVVHKMIIITKTITKDDSCNHNFILWIHLYEQFLVSLLLCFIGKLPRLKTLVYLIFAGLSGTLLHLCINHAL
jgi:hypothetical protein